MQKMIGLMLIGLLTGCHAWSGSVQRLQEECGADAATPEAGQRLVQLTTPEGERLNAADIEATRVSFEGQSLHLSARGCTNVPDTTGTLLAQNSLRGWALASRITAHLDFQTLRFVEPATGAVELVCPTGGWLTKDRLDAIVSFPSGFVPELTQLSLKINDSRGTTLSLLDKAVGLSLDGRWQGFDLAMLPEGSYQLQLDVRDLSRDWDASAMTAFRTCPLQVIRHVPELKPSSLPEDHIFPMGHILTPEFVDPSDRLFVCREPGFQPKDSCEAQSLCRDPENYKEQALLRLDEKGAWTYFYFGKNRLGQASRQACLPTYVSDSAPEVAVRWKKTAWNEFKAQERQLPPDMEALIDVKGGILSREDVAENLSCKVDFIFRGESVFPGNKVTCLSGRCQGQTMGRYVPCDTTLRFAIGEALQTEFLPDSEIRLSVKASDGAGHEQEATTSLWLIDSQHRREDFAGNGPEDLGVMDQPAYFWWTQEGALLVQTAKFFSDIRFHYLSRWMDWGYSKVWKDANKSAMPGKPTSASVVQVASGRIFALFPTLEYVNSVPYYRRFIAEFVKGEWQEKKIEGWDPLKETCETLSAELDGRVLCQTGNELIVIDPDKGTLQRSTITLDEGTLACTGFTKSYVATPKDLLYRFCDKGVVLVRDRAGHWSQFNLPRDYQPVLESLIYDAEGRMWIQATTYTSTAVTDYLLRIEGTRVEEIPMPMDVESFGVSNGRFFALDDQGFVRYADRRWNPAAQTWDKIPELREWLGAGPMRVRHVQGTTGGLWYETSKFMLYLNGSEKQIFPLKSLNWSSPDYPTMAAVGPNKQLCFIFRSENSSDNLRCQVPKSWSRVGRNYLNLPKDKIVYTDQTPKGEPLVATQHEGVFAWKGSSWQQVAPPPPVAYDKFRSLYVQYAGAIYFKADREYYRYDAAAETWVLLWTQPKLDSVNNGWGWFAFTDGVGQLWFTLMGGKAVRFDGQNWEIVLPPQGMVPNNVMAVGDRLLMLLDVNQDHQAFYWVNPKTNAYALADLKAEFGFDSELLDNMPRSYSAIMDREAIILTAQNDKFMLKSVIFDLKSRKQAVFDNYDRRGWNQKMTSFNRVDESHYLIVYPTLLGAKIGPNQDFRVISTRGQDTLLFTSYEMKQLEDNFDLSFSTWSWFVDDQKRVWSPAGTFGQDISDELFRIDLKPWLD